MLIKFYNYDELTSTNDIALEKLNKSSNKTDTLFVVTAKCQTAGRGRNNKVWHGNHGDNLYYSCAFCHNLEKTPLSIVQVIGGLVAYSVISKLLNKDNVRLKYPNDIYVIDKSINTAIKKYKKIAGIIAEHSFHYQEFCDSLIGIGINNKQTVFPQEISSSATSLYLQNCNISNEKLQTELTAKIVELLDADYQKVRILWENTINIWQKDIKIINNINQNVSDTIFRVKKFLINGELLLKDELGNERTISNGDSIIYDLC